MAWENCIESLGNYYQLAEGKTVKDFTEVNWKTNPNARAELNDDKPFALGNPYYLVCPQRHCLDNVDITPNTHKKCSCTDVNGNPLPPELHCQPVGVLHPYRVLSALIPEILILTSRILGILKVEEIVLGKVTARLGMKLLVPVAVPALPTERGLLFQKALK